MLENEDDKNLFKGKTFVVNIKKGHSIPGVLHCFKEDNIINSFQAYEDHFALKEPKPINHNI